MRPLFSLSLSPPPCLNNLRTWPAQQPLVRLVNDISTCLWIIRCSYRRVIDGALGNFLPDRLGNVRFAFGAMVCGQHAARDGMTRCIQYATRRTRSRAQHRRLDGSAANTFTTEPIITPRQRERERRPSLTQRKPHSYYMYRLFIKGRMFARHGVLLLSCSYL